MEKINFKSKKVKIALKKVKDQNSAMNKNINKRHNFEKEFLNALEEAADWRNNLTKRQSSEISSFSAKKKK